MTSFGLYAKAGTPTQVSNDYAAVVTEALGTPSVTEVLHKMGLIPVGGTATEFHKKVLSDRARWAPVIKDAGIKMDV